MSLIKDAIKRYDAARVCLQVPEGLKPDVLKMAGGIEALGVEVVIVADLCFGACDLADDKAEQLGCDLLVHVGHSQFVRKTSVPVVYVEHKSDYDPVPLLSNNIKSIKEKNIGVLTTLQHIDYVNDVKKTLERKGKKAFVGVPELAKHNGQLLGCDISAAMNVYDKVDAFLFFGTGRFHPLGVARAVDKPVYFLNLGSANLSVVNDESWQAKRIMKLEKYREAEKVGVLVSTKKGQLNEKYMRVRKKVEEDGKKAYAIAMDRISPEKLEGMELDVLVNTACPRMEEDVVFRQPVLGWRQIS